jgi:8-amino-7-oxononanoate synthase
MSTDSPFDVRLRARLEALGAAGLLRTRRPPDGVDLSSNDYLRLSRHPAVVSRFVETAARDGVGSTGSRLLTGERVAFDAVERRFAAFKGTESALYFSSGYLANLAVLTTLPEAGDTIFSDAHNHASLIDGCRLSRARTVVFPHGDVGVLRGQLQSCPNGARFVVVESVFSMDGDLAPLSAYAELCQASGARLVVDEAHAVGLFGRRGSGLIEAEGVGAAVLASINTAGKALGVAGAFVAGSALVTGYLAQRARTFVFSTAPPPAVAAALEASLDLVEADPAPRARVLQLAARLRSRLASAGIDPLPGASQIVSLVIGANETAVRIAAALQSQGFDVRAIRPPSVPEGTARLRVSINVDLCDAELDRFTAVLLDAFREAGVFCAASS